MIKFFRHIRKSLLSEGKTGKYLKYAIGEIILVIIGILIAIQINNWNEDRKATAKTKNYISALNTEIEANIFALDNYIKIVHSDIEGSAKTHRLLNIPEAKTYNDSVLKNITDTGPIIKPTFATSTFDDFINAGILENLSNLKLKNNILSIVPSIERVNGHYLGAKDSWDNYQLPYHMKYANVANNWDSLSNIKIEKLPFKRKIDAFIYNNEYANILALRMRMLANYEKSLKEAKQTFIVISDKIKQYLKED